MCAALNFLAPRMADDGLSETRDPKGATAGPELVSDRRFWGQLQSLRELKSFLVSEGLVFKEDDLGAIQLGELDLLVFSPRGRMPTMNEWRQIDEKMNSLAKYLDYRLRRKRTLLRLRLYFRTLPLFFLFLAIFSLFADSYTRFLVGASVFVNAQAADLAG
jgi:hypothetical protein